MVRLLLEDNTDTHYEIIGIYRSELSEPDGVQACTSFEVVAGPKTYARVWDEKPDTIEWGWTLHPLAHSMWRAAD